MRLHYRICLLVLAVAGAQSAQAAPWVNTGPLNVARHSHTATLLLDGKVLLAGGAVSAVLTNAAELYDPATGKCQPTGFMSDARRNATATLLLNGKVLVTGGFNLSSTDLSTAELYDP